MLLGGLALFSEKSAPISELIKGEPDKPLREPALALFACVFNVYTIYQISQLLNVISILPFNPYDPWGPGWYFQIVIIMASGVLTFSLIYTILLLIGSGVMYFLTRRAGAVLVLVVSILALLVSFMGVAYGGFGLLIASILGIFSGALGIRSVKETPQPQTVYEVI